MHESLRLTGELKPLKDPVLIAAFRGWNDPAGTTVAAVRHLREEWNAREVAEIDPEPFYDFTVQRPWTRMRGDERILRWPICRFHVAQPEGAGRDFVFLTGREPSLRWRLFTEVIAEVMNEAGVSTSLTLGARPAAVPHTRATPVSLVNPHPYFEDIFDLPTRSSRYQGPTGIITVLNIHHRSLNWRSAQMSAMVPHYLSASPNPKAVISLIQAIDRGFGTSTSVEGLDDNVREFEEQVRQVMEQSAEAPDYVKQLEKQYDANPPLAGAPETGDEAGADDLPSSADLIGDLERFLRERRKEDD